MALTSARVGSAADSGNHKNILAFDVLWTWEPKHW